MSAFPDPAARSADEAAFLRAILADLPNDLPKLVYADWLDDRDDDRAAAVRAGVEAVRGGRPPAVGRKPAGWQHLTGFVLHAELYNQGLADLADVLVPLAAPAIDFRGRKAKDKSLAVGASKIGGDPDLPAGADWPAVNGRPLAFMVQLNLADVAGSPAAAELPQAGLLSVFNDRAGIDADDRNYTNHRVVFTPAGKSLVRHPQPAGQSPENLTPACRVTFHECLSLPEERSPWAKELKAVGDRDMEYMTLTGNLGAGGHQLLGYPVPIQSDILGRKTRRHLLTLGTDEAAGWEFMGGGCLYYTLTAGDLAKGRLDRVKFDLQSD